MIPREYVNSTCRPGQREATCAYLTFAAGGMKCAKAMPEVRAEIDQRLADGTMSAKGDNCDGWFEE